MVAWLLANGADPNGVDEFGGTALHSAAEAASAECVKLLLDAGAEARRNNDVESEPIHMADSEVVIRLLIERGQADPNVIDGCGDWPMKSAARNNDVALAEALLAMGADCDLTSSGGSALHEAIRHDAREFAAWLLAHGADVNAVDCDQWTPLFHAESREAVALLRRHGADFDHRDQCGELADQWWKDPLLRDV
jgi:ankyrin repeat protein